MGNNANYSSIIPDYKASKSRLTPPGVLCLKFPGDTWDPNV